MEKIINTVVWAALIQGFILAMLYIFSKKHSSKANVLLGLFLLCFVFEAMSMWVPYNRIGNYQISDYFNLPEVKLFFPVLFLNYVVEKLGVTCSCSKVLKIVYLLSFAVVGITGVNFVIFLTNGKSIQEYVSWNVVSNVFMLNQYLAFFLTISAIIIAIKEVLNYKAQIRNEYADLDMFNIRWLWHFIFAVIPITFMWGLELLRIALGGTGFSSYVLMTWAFIILFIYWISFRAFQHKNLFDGLPINDLKSSKEISSIDTSKTDYKELSRQLSNEMEANTYYLNQDLNIYDLSKSMNTPSRQLSACINNEMGVNFNEWVNNYRVEAALKLLKDQSKAHYSIEGIGEDSGFKSRSAMYAAFKKKIGHSPGHFRNL